MNIGNTPRPGTRGPSPTRWWRRWAGGAAVLAVIASAGTAGVALAPEAAAGTPGCLWSGAQFRQDGTVYAGGLSFTCRRNESGASYWSHEWAPGQMSSVASPGTGYPIGSFSPGAWQPGSDYNDYCVGDQLVEGADAVYELRADAAGFLSWHAVASIAQWDFTVSSPHPLPTRRSASLCIDGVLS
ncbi:hypothetical protein [Nocardia sp. NBC_01388]|uniref:hypothetical protein n=1 Tax=Nocardia sp. NBC_01388 TaxID=2903596 RepID=UPI003254A923